MLLLLWLDIGIPSLFNQRLNLIPIKGIGLVV